MSEYVYYSKGTPMRDASGNISLPREEIVRCRDCKHASYFHPLDWRTGKPSETFEEWYCNWHANAEGASDIEPDGYCAWAVKRTGAENG